MQKRLLTRISGALLVSILLSGCSLTPAEKFCRVVNAYVESLVASDESASAVAEVTEQFAEDLVAVVAESGRSVLSAEAERLAKSADQAAAALRNSASAADYGSSLQSLADAIGEFRFNHCLAQ
jgi:hypothetical protein